MIPLPLKYYDESGHVLPPRILWWCVLYLCKAYFLFIASATLPGQGGEVLLKMFYPVNSQFYIAASIGVPALALTLVLGFREKLRKKRWYGMFWLIYPLPVMALIAELGHTLWMLHRAHWAFSWVMGANTIVASVALLWLVRSKHMRILVRDWLKPDPDTHDR